MSLGFNDKYRTGYPIKGSQIPGPSGSRGRGHETSSVTELNDDNNAFQTPRSGQVMQGIRAPPDKRRFGGGTRMQKITFGFRSFYTVPTYRISTFTVKSADVAKIIGKGGKKIREFEEESGAYIQIGRKSTEKFGQTTSVSLYGPDEAAAKAKELVETFLSTFGDSSSGNPEKQSCFQRTANEVPQEPRGMAERSALWQ